jgi:pyocin large subunit-like protein
VEGYPAKLDSERVLRIFDPRSGTFGAYNPDGTTKTFFKPGNARYFDRQPGRPINLKTGR